MSMSATQRAAVPGNAPADEEGNSSKQAASAVTAFGTAPGKTPPAAAHSGALSIHEPVTAEPCLRYNLHGNSDNEGSDDDGHDREDVYDLHDNSDNEGSDDDGDDREDGAGTTSSRGKDAAEHARGHHDGMPKALRGYTAPSHDEIMKLANRGVLQPPVPVVVKLMSLRSWELEIIYVMGEEGMAAAGKGLARIDKGMADKKQGLRLVRNFVRNKDGKFVDSDLEHRAPLLFALVKILMEKYDFQHVALQKLTAQMFHCDPHARNATSERDEKECHFLLTVDGFHSFGLSTSRQIQTMAERFKTWKGGGCAAHKIKAEDLDDVLFMDRGGELPLQLVKQSLLGGRPGDSEDSKACVIPIHAGVPWSIKSGSGDPAWMTPQEFGDRVQARKQAFQKKGGNGISASTSLLANYPGTQQDAAKALEDAATLVLQAHVRSQGSMTLSTNASVLLHQRDLVAFEKMLVLDKISSLAQTGMLGLGGSKKGRMTGDVLQEHIDLSVLGGGSKRGRMTGDVLQEHIDLSVLGGASKKGRMTGDVLQEHIDLSVLGGASTKGRMTDDDLQEHRALMDQGYTKKHKLMMQLANGKEGQKNFWECSTSKRGNAVFYHFRANNEATIDGVREFENYLLNDENGFVPDKLTQKGKDARDAMKRTRVQAAKDKDRRERKKIQQAK